LSVPNIYEHRLIHNVPGIKLFLFLFFLIHYYIVIKLIFVVCNAVYVHPQLFCLFKPIYCLQQSGCRITILNKGNPVLSHYHDLLLILSLFMHSFIHLVVCLTTGPKSLPKRALRIVRSTASPFNKSILSFPYGHPVDCCVFFRIFLSLMSPFYISFNDPF
jgi:hypothetical protein